MDDKKIVQLYFDRNPVAIEETLRKYKNYCTYIAKNILRNEQDAEECVNDALHNVWKSIPPEKPDNLRTYIGKITRHLSFDCYRRAHAQKRGKGELEIVLDELKECVSGAETPEQEIDRKELGIAINEFLDTLSGEKCGIFVCRYWYALSISQIAVKFHKTETNISVILNRLRKELKKYLNERGYEV